jgi:hypothetical protein
VGRSPIVITEVDWSPEQPGTGHYNEHGEWVVSNMGTWATASTSKWGMAFKKILDYFGNISMTLSGTSTYIDIDHYLSTGEVRPAFGGHPEACAAACFEWYKEYAMQMNADYVALGIEGVEAEEKTIEENSLVYDLLGRRQTTIKRGLNIIRTISADGTVNIKKVIKD